MTYVNAHSRLVAMPPLFDLGELQRAMGTTRSVAAVYASRWKASGLVVPLGERQGVWFNLVADPRGVETRKAEAVAKLLRRPAIVVGGKALHAHGWTTQRHHMIDLAVPVARSIRTLPRLMHGIRLLPRSISWFNVIQAGSNGEIGTFDMARPDLALADAMLSDLRGIGVTSGHGTPYVPQPDDIDFDDQELDLEATATSLRELGANEGELASLLEPFGWENASPCP